MRLDNMRSIRKQEEACIVNVKANRYATASLGKVGTPNLKLLAAQLMRYDESTSYNTMTSYHQLHCKKLSCIIAQEDTKTKIRGRIISAGDCSHLPYSHSPVIAPSKCKRSIEVKSNL